MNSRERVLIAINHQEADRVPIDLGGTAATGIHINAYMRLKKAYGLSTDNIKVFDLFGMMAQVEKDVIQRVGADVMLIPSLSPRFGIPIDRWKNWQLFDGTIVKVPLGFEISEDSNGDLLLMVSGEAVGKMPQNGYHFSELANAAMGGIDSLEEPPDPDTQKFSILSDEDLYFRQRFAKNLRNMTDKALIVDLVDNIRWNTSIANWLFAMGTDPKRTMELHEKKSLCILQQVKQLEETIGQYVDIFAIYQDFGTQRAELIAPETFNELVLPHYKRIFDWIHNNTNWKVLFHSCGSIRRIIPSMIKMGVDILNPVQVNAAGMNAMWLKEEFGDKITFWGGGIDTQTVLPYGSIDEVRQQVKERLSTFAPGGGFIFAPTQDIQPDVPVENLLAMYQAVKRYGQYHTL